VSSPVTTFKGLVSLMEEWAWAEDDPLPSEQMRDAYWKMRVSPTWGYLVENMAWADKEVVPLVNALNIMRGIVTVESCSGHGNASFYICFYAETVNAVQRLFDLISSRRGWRIIFEAVGTEGKRSFMFTLKGPMGERAYHEADELAATITDRKEA
jgi:hypothetical protein